MDIANLTGLPASPEQIKAGVEPFGPGVPAFGARPTPKQAWELAENLAYSAQGYAFALIGETFLASRLEQELAKRGVQAVYSYKESGIHKGFILGLELDC
jgi:hypothetical protein